MNQNEIKALFDQQAASYDTQWVKTAAIQDCLHLLVESLFVELPTDARILCVGVATGAELVHLARRNRGWRFTVVEPSGPMLDICRQRAEQEGFMPRCVFHQGYLESLSVCGLHDAATCFLVSHFILQPQARSEFFRQIATRLKPAGLLASSDLASDVNLPEYRVLLHAWMTMMATAKISHENVERLRQAYANDVGIFPPNKVAAIIASGGFEFPVQFFQAGLIHAWLSKRVQPGVSQ